MLLLYMFLMLFVDKQNMLPIKNGTYFRQYLNT